jgi:hypothetical protein
LDDGELQGILEHVEDLIEQRELDALDKSVGPVADLTGPGLFRPYLLKSRKSRPPTGFQSVGVVIGGQETHAVVWPATNPEVNTLQIACERGFLGEEVRPQLQLTPPTCGRCIGSCRQVVSWQVVYEEDDE